MTEKPHQYQTRETSEKPYEPREVYKDSSKSTFETYFPGEITEIDSTSIPEQAISFFEWQSGYFVTENEPYVPGNFDSHYKIDRNDGVTTYTASQHRIKPGSSLRTQVYFYEMLGEDQLGYGTISLEDEYLKDYPYSHLPVIIFNRTIGNISETDDEEKSFTRQKYGTKRILEMGAYSLAFFNKELHSVGANRLAVGAWDNLIAEGLAEEIKLGPENRRKFKLKLKPVK